MEGGAGGVGMFQNGKVVRRHLSEDPAFELRTENELVRSLRTETVFYIFSHHLSSKDPNKTKN